MRSEEGWQEVKTRKIVKVKPEVKNYIEKNGNIHQVTIKNKRAGGFGVLAIVEEDDAEEEDVKGQDVEVMGAEVIKEVIQKTAEKNIMNRFAKKEEAVKHICTVMENGPKWRKLGSGEITVDSAAEESACPKEWCPEYPTKKPTRWMKFANASGGQMGHYGEKAVTFTTGPEAKAMSLGFQVSDVQKPLAVVRRITEKGNRVQFGPAAEDNFIQHVATGNKVMMVRKGGSYVIPAETVVDVGLGFPGQAQ